MFSVIFEVHPRKERFDDYLELAKYLKPKLEKIDGFVDNERFESKHRPGWLLSHSTWRDEKSVIRWRTLGEHHEVQAKGRSEIFEDYHLRVGDVTFDSAPPPAAPIVEQRFDATEVGEAIVATLTEVTPNERRTLEPGRLAAHLGLDTRDRMVAEHDVFASIYNLGKLALLVSWQDAEAGVRWSPARPDSAADVRHRVVRIIRDYGMFDRREAPQYYPPAQR